MVRLVVMSFRFEPMHLNGGEMVRTSIAVMTLFWWGNVPPVAAAAATGGIVRFHGFYVVIDFFVPRVSEVPGTLVKVPSTSVRMLKHPED